MVVPEVVVPVSVSVVVPVVPEVVESVSVSVAVEVEVGVAVEVVVAEPVDEPPELVSALDGVIGTAVIVVPVLPEVAEGSSVLVTAPSGVLIVDGPPGLVTSQ